MSVRERTVQWNEPTELAERLLELDGAAGLRLMMESGVGPPIASLMNIRLVEVEAGRVVFEGEPREYHYNPIGSVHGGFALTIFDSALGCAVHSALPAGVRYTSTDVQVRFIAGMTKDTGVVRCEARAVHIGRSTGVSEARLTDANGKLLGIGTTACAILRS